MSFVKLAQEKIQPGPGLGPWVQEGAAPLRVLTFNMRLPCRLLGLSLDLRRARP